MASIGWPAIAALMEIPVSSRLPETAIIGIGMDSLDGLRLLIEWSYPRREAATPSLKGRGALPLS